MHIKRKMRYDIDRAVGKKVNFIVENPFFANQVPIINLYKRQQINCG